jgi:hypothetical protein
MSDPDLSNSIVPWFLFSDELRINALHLLNQPTLELGDAGLAQPKVFAAALLARTITNHKAVLMLLRAGLITEARTLTRSCLENVLWMRRIKAEGMEFVTAILDDARQADISFAKTLLPSVHLTKPIRTRLRLSTFSSRVYPGTALILLRKHYRDMCRLTPTAGLTSSSSSHR